MTVDLKSGMTYPHRREDYCTKSTACDPGGDCPLWFEFLERITDHNQELEDYLQRVAGYCLTGITSEHVLFFLYGTGANGKTVFVNTITGMMGDYAVTAPMEMFMTAHSDRHPTELAMLRGARLVTATETEDGRRWSESKIKALTGGDRIAARFMRQDFFEFTPQFKLMVAGNHKPSLRSVDEAIRRRIHLIPFIITIPPEQRDHKLADKLKDEWPGILSWAIEGCLQWQRNGLVFARSRELKSGGQTLGKIEERDMPPKSLQLSKPRPAVNSNLPKYFRVLNDQLLYRGLGQELSG